MNIFLLSPNIRESCQELAELDPKRARKQLVECCQLLATVDHIKKGSTNMLRADGTPYKMAHPHHPITKHMCISYANVRLCVGISYCLSNIYATNACAYSFNKWMYSHCDEVITGTYCVCRKGQEVVYVDSLEEYSELMRPYVTAKIDIDRYKKILK